MPGYGAYLIAALIALPAAAPAGDWSGGYAGGQVSRLEFEISDGAMSFDGIKGTYGLHAGYAHDFGRLVTAAELEYDRSNIDLQDLGRLDNALRLRALLGYDLDRVLPYAVLGYAWGDISGGPVGTAKGPLFGIGVSYRLSPEISVGAEFVHHSFTGKGDLDGDAENLSIRIDYRF